jgi:type I site-specific restriction endonuclease
MNERIQELAEQASGTRKYVRPVWQFYDDELEKFAELLIRDVLAQVEEIQRLDQTLKKKVGIDFEIKVAYEVLKNYGLRSGYCACCGVPAGQPHDNSCVWS